MRPHRSKLYFPLVAALAVTVLMAPAVGAAEPTPSEISVARRLFEEGKAAEDAKRWRDAAEKFRQAAAIKDTPGLRFHLARCEEEQSLFVEALVEYDRARELLESGVKAPDVERLLPEARERVRAKVAQLTVRLPPNAANASVSIDGKPVSKSVLNLPLPINPGKHRLQAVAAGRTPFDRVVQLGAGEVREIAVVLPASTGSTTPTPTPAVATVAPPTDPAAASQQRSGLEHDSSVPTKTIVMVGEASLLAAGLGTGIIFSLAHASANDRFDAATDKVLAQAGGSDQEGSACSPPHAVPACAELDQARDDRSRAGTLATVGFIAAGVSVAALGLTWWLWPSGPAPAEASIAVDRDGMRLSLSGRF